MVNKIDLSAKNHDYAIFTPALSAFYSSYVSKQQSSEYVEAERIPQKFEKAIEALKPFMIARGIPGAEDLPDDISYKSLTFK